MPRKPTNAWPSRDPAQFRHQIKIQAQTSVPDEFGQPQPIWTTVWRAHASIKSAIEQEAYQSGEFFERVIHLITIRYPRNCVTLSPGMRVLYASHTYLVQDFNNMEERDIFLELRCLAIDEVQ